jgi:PKD repeat protein
VDGKLRGETPLTLGAVAAGDHRVTVAKDGYLENSRVVSVGSGQSNALRINLTRGASSNARMQVEPEPMPPSAPPAAEKKGGGSGTKVALIVLGAAAVGGGVYLLLPKNKPPVVTGVTANPPVALMAATPVSFSAAASDPDGDSISYKWDFGDGATGTGANPTHVYPSAGPFTVRVEVSDGKKSASATATVTVVSTGGTWNGTLQTSTPYPMTLQLTQQGTMVNGTFRSFGGDSYAVNGTVSAPRSVNLVLSSYPAYTLRGEVSADGAAINGMYGYPGGQASFTVRR